MSEVLGRWWAVGGGSGETTLIHYLAPKERKNRFDWGKIGKREKKGKKEERVRGHDSVTRADVHFYVFCLPI